MINYLFTRLWHSIVVLLGVSLIVFVLMHVSGDPIRLLVPPDAGEATVQLIRHEYGLDQPLYIQYWRFLSKAIHGDFGESFRHNEPALNLVLERVPATFELTVVAVLFMIVIAIPAGIVAAMYKNTWIDGISMSFALLGQSIPIFWLGIMLIIILSVRFRLLPPGGRDGIESLIMPGITLGAYSAALITRLTRSAMVDVLVQDYIRTARSKGVPEKLILIRHALKNASIPIITVIGMQTGILLGGAVITETVFSYPGMGLLAIQAIGNRDFPVVEAFVFVTAIIIILMNLLVDLTYVYLDPRIKLHA
jgi:peptide/nickel transport system permease protein